MPQRIATSHPGAHRKTLPHPAWSSIGRQQKTSPVPDAINLCATRRNYGFDNLQVNVGNQTKYHSNSWSIFQYPIWVLLFILYHIVSCLVSDYMVYVLYDTIFEGSLEVKLPTIWTDEKQSRSEAERREKIRREKSRRERVRRKKMQMREKVGKSLAKAADAEPVGQMRDEKLHAVVRTTFGSWDVEKVHATTKHISKTKC